MLRQKTTNDLILIQSKTTERWLFEAFKQGWARPDLDHRYRDWKCLSLNDETETETEKVWVSMTRPRPRLKRSESQWRDRDWKGLSLNDVTKTETEKVWVSMTRPRLKRSESQWRDRDLTFKCRNKKKFNLNKDIPPPLNAASSEPIFRAV